MKAATQIRFRSRPIFSTSPSLRSACANTSLATLTVVDSRLSILRSRGATVTPTEGRCSRFPLWANTSAERSCLTRRFAGRLQRVHPRPRCDLEMIKSMGYCHCIENYSRHFSGRLPGEPPPTLLDYFPRDFLLFVDESHATIPQVHGM